MAIMEDIEGCPKKKRSAKISDKQRLDWLKRQDFCIVQRADSKLGKWFHYSHVATTYYYGCSPRAAIDAAIRASQRTKKRVSHAK